MGSIYDNTIIRCDVCNLFVKQGKLDAHKQWDCSEFLYSGTKQTKIRGIYAIQNKLNNRIYIGKSIDIIRRWYEHVKSSISNELDSDIHKLGAKNFTFHILEVCENDIEDLGEREYFYVQKYKTFDKKYGYNTKSKRQKSIK